MFKLSSQFKIISICLFVVVGLFLINNKKLYAFPGINLDVRKNQIQGEINSLVIEMSNIFNDMSIDSSTRLNRMTITNDRINILFNELEMINQQINIRDMLNLQRNNNENRQNHTRR
ncbi:SVM family protein, partial [Candidatus Phytoplasma citri]